MKAVNYRKLLLWLLNLTLFVMLPILLFFFGFSHIDKLHRTSLMKVVEQSIDSEMQNFEAHIHTERFLGGIFKETYRQNSAATASESYNLLWNQLDGCFDYMIWNASQSFVAGSISPQAIEGDWDLAWKTLEKPFMLRNRDVAADENEMKNLRKMFGPQIVLQMVDDYLSDRVTGLMWCDSAGRRPPVWIGHRRGFSVAIFVPGKNLTGKRGLEYYLKYGQKPDNLFKLGFVKGKQIFGLTEPPDDHQFARLLQHNSAPGETIETKEMILFPRVVEDDLTLFAYVHKTGALTKDLSRAVLFSFLVFLLLLPYVFVSGRALFSGQIVKISISRKLALLFAYANGLPLIMLFFAGYDFIHQKEFALYDELHAQGTRYLQNLDERFESEHALNIVNIQNAVNELKKELKQGPMQVQHFDRLVRQIYLRSKSRRELRIYLVASETRIFGTSDSLYIGENRHKIYSEILDSPDLRRTEEQRVFNSLGQFILATINGRPQDPKSSAEVEMIAESVMQKPLDEFQHDFVANDGRISVWGIGTNKSPACLRLISVNDDGLFDYMLIINWNQGILEKRYLNRQFLNANRNIPGLKIGLYHEPTNDFQPSQFPDKNIVKKHTDNFTSKPCSPRQFVVTNAHTYLLMGFVGRYLGNYRLFALYPVENVKEQIDREKTRLVFAGIASLLLTLILGQFLAHSFLFPLQKLHAGAEAIKARNFSMRLPPLGRDEFGEMAEIFNTTMVDLSELEVAGAIQEHLLPRQMPETGKFGIYGNIISMGELGGDYYDYFNTSPGRFSVLIGDVAGRGAGAALIMAMAKAVVMQLADLHEKPDELAHHLHDLLTATAKNARKTMTMQYLNIDGNSGSGVYTNAGGWPPLIVNPKTRSIREVDLPGPILGAMKKPRFATREVTFAPGEAMILYSDGIIEARNAENIILGLARLKEIALAAWHPDPKQYFSELLSLHRNFTGTATVQDDMTMIVISFAEQTREEQAS